MRKGDKIMSHAVGPNALAIIDTIKDGVVYATPWGKLSLNVPERILIPQDEILRVKDKLPVIKRKEIIKHFYNIFGIEISFKKNLYKDLKVGTVVNLEKIPSEIIGIETVRNGEEQCIIYNTEGYTLYSKKRLMTMKKKLDFNVETMVHLLYGYDKGQYILS